MDKFQERAKRDAQLFVDSLNRRVRERQSERLVEAEQTLGIDAKEMAKRLNVPLATYLEWASGREMPPDEVAGKLLRMIAAHCRES